MKKDRKDKKVRLDIATYNQGLCSTIEIARSYIISGKVLSKDRKYSKPCETISQNTTLKIKDAQSTYVSRGGDKLQNIITTLGLHKFIQDKTILDIGASTGGFTDCLLKYNPKKIIALDVGYNQLAWSLRTNPKVFSLEKTDIRCFSYPNKKDITFIVADISFNSLSRLSKKIVASSNAKDLTLLLLVKPQFELQKFDIPDGGVVIDNKLHQKAIDKVVDSFTQIGFHLKSTIASPIQGKKGNQEYFILLQNNKNTRFNKIIS